MQRSSSSSSRLCTGVRGRSAAQMIVTSEIHFGVYRAASICCAHACVFLTERGRWFQPLDGGATTDACCPDRTDLSEGAGLAALSIRIPRRQNLSSRESWRPRFVGRGWAIHVDGPSTPDEIAAIANFPAPQAHCRSAVRVVHITTKQCAVASKPAKTPQTAQCRLSRRRPPQEGGGSVPKRWLTRQSRDVAPGAMGAWGQSRTLPGSSP